MEQPLDLSQRESTVERSQKVVNIDMEEPICQYTNCSCPLKHILSLDKQEQGEVFTQRRETVTSDDYSRGPIHKEIQQTEGSPSHLHPKRRKIEQYKHSISRSASDTNLHGYGGPVEPYRSFTSYPGEDINHSVPEGKYQSNWKSSHTFTATNTYQYASGDISNPEVKFVPKHVERLPKKRSHARNLSYDNSIQSSQNSNMSSSCNSEMETSRTPSPKTISTNANMSQEGCDEAQAFDSSNLPKLNSGRRTNGEELRASIMAELHNEKDDEDVNEFRKRFFGSIFSRAKQGPALKGKPSAFDILISGKHSENFDFRPKNSHIDQIIRGEKAGKLCLMDIVELQVEIGLA